MKVYINETKPGVLDIWGLDKKFNRITLSYDKDDYEILNLKKDYGVLRSRKNNHYSEEIVDPKVIGEPLYNLLEEFSFKCIKEGESINHDYFTIIYIYTKDYLIELDFHNWMSDYEVFYKNKHELTLRALELDDVIAFCIDEILD